MKNVLHIIGSLGIGGAEVLLLNTINALGPEFNNIVVYLNNPDTLAPEFKNATLVCLNYTGKQSIPGTIFKIRSLIKSYKIDIVHAHLFWPSLIARLACPANVRLLFSVHSILSEDAFLPNPKSRLIEKLTYKSRHEVIFVSESVRTDYQKHVGIKGKNYILHNFISDAFFKEEPALQSFSNRPIKAVAIGNLKEAKNYPYLLRAFRLLNGNEITLDIYGEGHLRSLLQRLIDTYGLKNVSLKGLASNIPDLLRNYDIFILSSEHEGFGLAAIEAMASGLPCFLSDLPVFHEVTKGNAVFFDLKREEDLVKNMLDMLQDPVQLQHLSKKGLEHAKKYNRRNYISQLTQIYLSN